MRAMRSAYGRRRFYVTRCIKYICVKYVPGMAKKEQKAVGILWLRPQYLWQRDSHAATEYERIDIDETTLFPFYSYPFIHVGKILQPWVIIKHLVSIASFDRENTLFPYFKSDITKKIKFFRKGKKLFFILSSSFHNLSKTFLNCDYNIFYKIIYYNKFKIINKKWYNLKYHQQYICLP